MALPAGAPKRRKRARLLTALLASWVPAALAANYQLEVEAPAALVEDIRSRTLLGRWIDEPAYDPAQLPLFVERAREETAAIVRDAGYFSVEVDVRLEQTEPPTVRILVDAGPRTTVSEFDLRLEGADLPESLREELLAQWPQSEGSFFRPSTWEQGKRQMLDLLQRRGYMRARIVDSQARVDPVRTSARLRLEVAAGPRLAFGPLTVRGLERYDRSIVEALRPWDEARPGRPGDPYDFDALLQFQTQLSASGYFFGADVLPDLAAVEANPDLDVVPVIAVVRERRRQRVNFGVGLSSDEGVRALVGYENRDFLGRGLQLESGLLFQSVQRRAFASVRTPQRASGHYDQAGVRVERIDVQGELADRQTVFVGRGKRSEEIEHLVSLQYQAEQRLVPLDPATDHRQALTLGYAWNLRRVDSRIDPRKGYTISAQLSGAREGLLTDRSFVRLWGRAMRFWPMPEDSALDGGLLIGLLEVGQVHADSRQGIPTENLFRTGGTQSIRGYDYLSLGVPEAGAIVGGRVLAVGSIEYQHPIRPDWFSALFVDAGNAADRWSDWDAVYGMGVGVRWRSPVGPVSVDLAWGEAVEKWRLHLAVGYAF